MIFSFSFPISIIMSFIVSLCINTSFECFPIYVQFFIYFSSSVSAINRHLFKILLLKKLPFINEAYPKMLDVKMNTSCLLTEIQAQVCFYMVYIFSAITVLRCSNPVCPYLKNNFPKMT